MSWHKNRRAVAALGGIVVRHVCVIGPLPLTAHPTQLKVPLEKTLGSKMSSVSLTTKLLWLVCVCVFFGFPFPFHPL